MNSRTFSFLMIPVKAAAALILTFLLFFVFSIINGIFHSNIQLKKETPSPKRVLLERVSPPPPEPVRSEPKKMRTVSERTAQSSSSPSSGTASRFAPDLSLGGSGEGISAGGSGNGFAEMIYEEGQTDEPPMAVSRTPLAYPPAAQRARIEGTVEVVFLVNREGRVQDIEFKQVPHKMFEQPIRSAIQTWRFKPAMLQGVPVAVRVRQRVDFNLRQ